MTSVAAGGPVQFVPDDDLVVVGRASLRYGALVNRGRFYRVAIAPARLTAFVSETDDGFVAECPELSSLGYGPDPDSAVRDLHDAVRDYLTILAEKQPSLSPGVAHHAQYVQLLSTPEASWFASINGPVTAPSPNAADLE
jgi:hypothetical protein